MQDPIHLLVDCRSQFYISDMIKIMKGIQRNHRFRTGGNFHLRHEAYPIVITNLF